MAGHHELVSLELPAFEPRILTEDGRRTVFDPIRRKYVRLTPEEWVRQHFLHYLVEECGYPSALIAVEMGFQFQRMPRRADIVVHDRQGVPFLMAECKAPSVDISQSTFNQVSRYNRVVEARFLAATNGLLHYCWRVDHVMGHYEFLTGVPPYDPPETSSTRSST